MQDESIESSSTSPVQEGQEGDDPIGRAVAACQRGELEQLNRLLQSGEVAGSSVDSDGCSLLQWAAINNRVPIVQRLLEAGSDPNYLGGILESSALHWAARVGNLASCSVLIQAGAVCNVRDKQGCTPMHLAVQGQHTNLVAYLLEKFSYAASITDNSGMTPAMWSAYRAFSMFPLRLILHKLADIDAKEHLQGNTALHLAAQERNYNAVFELIEAGADVTVKNNQHETALDIAKNNRNERIIAMIEEGARRQGVMPKNCAHRMSKYRQVAQFLMPGSVLALVGLLFYFLHFGIAAALTLLLAIFLGCTVRIEMHGRNASLVPIGITVAEPCVMLILWSYQLHWFAPWWLQIMFYLIMTTLLLTLARLYFGDPGVIRASCVADNFVAAVESLSPRLNFCFSCWVDKPDGGKHCSVCDRCVRQFDHHCPWLHNCVTRQNLRLFLLFVFCVAALSAVYTAASLRLVILTIRDRGLDYLLEHHCFLIITAAIAVFHAFALSILFSQQCMQISSRVTTHDLIQRHRGHQTPAYPTHGEYSSSSSTHGHSHYGPYRLSCATRMRNIADFCAGRH